MTTALPRQPPSFPDEVVTYARVRYVATARRRARRRPDHPRQRLRPHQAVQLRAGRAGQPRPCPRRGARPHGVGGHRRHRQAVHLRRRRGPHRDARGSPPASRRWRSAGSGTGCSAGSNDSAVPTFALVNGAAMGGGLEIALHCHYRTLAGNARGHRAARVLPRAGARLGRHPAAAQPHRRGQRGDRHHREPAEPEQDAQRRPQAAELGIVDVTFESADFLEQSLRWAARVITRRCPGRPGRRSSAARRGPPRSPAAGRWSTPSCTGPPRPRSRALDLIELAERATLDEGFAAEDDALADLMMSEELRAGLYSFDLVQRRAKRPVGVPDKSLARPVTKVGVVGAGLMASQLALLFARRLEVPVVLTDLDQERLDKGVGYVHDEIDKLLTKKRVVAGRGQPAQGARHRVPVEGRVRRRRRRHRSRLRGPDGQAEGLRRGRGRRQRHLPAADEHLVAVGHRHGQPARPPRAGRRLPLLQPGGGAAAAGGRAGGGDRRPVAGHGLRGGQAAGEEGRAGQATGRRSSSTASSPGSWAR